MLGITDAILHCNFKYNIRHNNKNKLNTILETVSYTQQE